MSEQESLASIKILIAVAKADSIVQDSERNAIESTLGGQQLPTGTTLDSLLSENVDIIAEAAKITSQELKESTYSAAVAIIKADGNRAPEEVKVLEALRAVLGITPEKVSLFDSLFRQAKDTVSFKDLPYITNVERRAAVIKENTIKYAILSGVLGGFPLPGFGIAADLAVVGLQGKLVREIGQYYGQPLDETSAKALLGSIVGGAGARIALNNLAKFVPGFGIVFGATTSFATTWAISRVAVQYFESGGKMNAQLLRDAFSIAKKEGEKAYTGSADAIDEKRKSSEARIKQLADDLQNNKITREEYESHMSAL